MPMREYDRWFGGTGSAARVHAAMVAEHGEQKGEEVFYATMNAKKKKMRKAMLAGSKHGR